MRVAAVVGVVLMGLSGAAAAQEVWSRVSVPSAGLPMAIGSPAAGCLQGAEALPETGLGYQVLRPSRNRFWGHPSLVAFLKRLGAQSREAGLPDLLVGDMAQPRGGPMPSGHGSHQTGIDADIWFKFAKARLGQDQLERPEPVSLVKGDGIDKGAWDRNHYRVLELAARAPEVDRIFVNPVIKRQMCRLAPAGDRDWLAKLRPWWGHDEHFHIRLSCPVGDIACVPQKPVPDGDGCGAELESWLAKGQLPKLPEKPHHQARALPSACTGVAED
jgi:penicillin-insensitive murein endopeptidase